MRRAPRPIAGASGEQVPGSDQPGQRWKPGPRTATGHAATQDAPNFEPIDGNTAVILEVGKGQQEASAGFMNTLGHEVVDSVAFYKSTLNECTAPSEITHKQASPTKYSGLLSGQVGHSVSQHGDSVAKGKPSW